MKKLQDPRLTVPGILQCIFVAQPDGAETRRLAIVSDSRFSNWHRLPPSFTHSSKSGLSIVLQPAVFDSRGSRNLASKVRSLFSSGSSGA